jgi:hypothetical protein
LNPANGSWPTVTDSSSKKPSLSVARTTSTPLLPPAV